MFIFPHLSPMMNQRIKNTISLALSVSLVPDRPFSDDIVCGTSSGEGHHKTPKDPDGAPQPTRIAHNGWLPRFVDLGFFEL
jgi:hypothetical protein